mgnify:CR=1 FL=1
MPGCAQHIIQRGNNRNACFYSESDYKFYLHLLEVSSRKYEVSIHAFVLMTNHVHFLATPASEFGVSGMMQSIGRSYVQYINYTYERTGTLWEGRYKSTLVDSDYYCLIASRYIELNPVRARMVEHPAEYPWSSYQSNGLGKKIKLLTAHYLYEGLGTTKEERLKNYRGLYEGHIPEKTLEELRDATNKGWAVGSEKFIEEVQLACGRAARKRKRGGDRRSNNWDQ